jgi:hypothetical protein
MENKAQSSCRETLISRLADQATKLERESLSCAAERGEAPIDVTDTPFACEDCATNAATIALFREAIDQLTALSQAQARLEAERDLAIAHDRQPYPTAWAYEQVCKARDKWQARAEAAEALLAGQGTATFGRCPTCGHASLVGVPVPCPDRVPGCLVGHLRVWCARCDPDPVLPVPVVQARTTDRP